MNIKQLRTTFIAATVGAILSGCANHTIYDDPTALQWGEANRQTMMAQVVDPDPQYDAPAVSSGDHAAQAVQRYREDQVKEPTTSSSSSSSSSSSGSSSSTGTGSN